MSDAAPDARLDLILQQIGALPTLSPIAVRVMAIGESSDADLREISQLIQSDPALSAKVVALCRRADLGISGKITTVERAVVMLGLEAVRAALLSVEVHEAFEQTLENTPARGPALPGEFERGELWRHSLAVACAAELLAHANAGVVKPLTPPEAFLAGLLHDLGKLALDAILPQTYLKVTELAAARQMNIAEVERRVIGIDHHTAGKRLAEHWGLPHALQDVMWLHGQDPSTLPDVPHRALIGVVSAADALARHLHLGWSGNFTSVGDPEAACARHGLSPSAGSGGGQWEARLCERVAQRAADLGLSESTTPHTLLRCLARANARLGRLTGMVEERARAGGRGAAAMEHLAAFYASHAPTGLVAAMEGVGRSALAALGPGALVLVMQNREGADWSMHRVNAEGRIAEHTSVPPPKEWPRLADLLGEARDSAARASGLAWLAHRAKGLCGDRALQVLPMAWSGGLSAALVHDRPDALQRLGDTGLRVLAAAWGSQLASAARHEGARRLGENLAEANRRLTEAQSRLVEAEALARLGRMTAGAAHEMNNPLTVISGQSQLLLAKTSDPEAKRAMETVVGATQRLSDLIASLHVFAQPPAPRRTQVNVRTLLERAQRTARDRVARDLSGGEGARPEVRVVIEGQLPLAHLDDDQICLGVTEVIVNALQARPKSGVEVRAHIDSFDDRLVLSVVDDGVGMTPEAAMHACDPFFSDLPAGRRVGLGLTRAKRSVELHGGELVLESTAGQGTCVRIMLPNWRAAGGAGAKAA